MARPPLRSWLFPACLLPFFLTVTAVDAAVRPTVIAVNEATPAWDAPQFVEADGAGNVFFFRGDTLEVYPLLKEGGFGKPSRLKTTVSSPRNVSNAALSPAGDRWLVQDGRSVRLFVDGKEKLIPPLPWVPGSVGFRRGEPVVAVIPFPLGGNSVDVDKLGTPPWLMELDNDKAWDSFVDSKGKTAAEILETLKTGEFNRILADSTAFMTADRQGKLWVAKGYSYRVQRYSLGGRLLYEIVVGDGKVREKPKKSQEIEIARRSPTQNPTEATRDPAQEKGSYFAFTAEPAIFDLAEGRDGKLYLLTRTETGAAALDRYDPVESILERILLQMKTEGRFTMAAGKDGLYLAAWNGKQGRWKLAWETLEQADWEEVKADVSGTSREE